MAGVRGTTGESVHMNVRFCWRYPPLPLKSPPLQPCGGGGDRHLGPESIGNTRRQRRQRKILQGAKGGHGFGNG